MNLACFSLELRCGPCFLTAYTLIGKIKHTHTELLSIIDSGQEGEKYK